jgi:hypothetical protein
VFADKGRAILFALILSLAAFLRFGPIFSGLPYSDYIDEGFVIHQAISVLKSRSYDVRWYGYPTLPAYLTVAAMLAANPVYRAYHGHGFRRDLPGGKILSQPFGYEYDLISPRELIIVGRLLTAAFSIATVVLAGLVAARLESRLAGTIVMILVGVCPALVLRASNTIVDTFSSFFVMLTLYLCERMRRSWSLGWAAAAGAAAGASFACKYTAGAIFVTVLAAIFLFRSSKAKRVQLTGAAALGLGIAMVVCVPAIILNWQSVARDLAGTAAHYGTIFSNPGYFGQAILPTELGWPFVLTGCVGIAVAFRQKSTRWMMVTWGLFAVLSLTLFLTKSFQPFRNLLPLVAPFCVAGGIALAKAISLLPRPLTPLKIASGVALVSLVPSLMLCHSGQSLYQRMIHRDSRVLAIDWLRDHMHKDEKVIALKELAILPEEWRRVPAASSTASFTETFDLLDRGQFNYLVTGDLDQRFAGNSESWPQQIARWRQKIADLPAAVEFGSGPTFVVPYFWRTNDERIVILKIK